MTPEEMRDLQIEIAAQGRLDPLAFAEEAWPWGVPGTPLEKKDIRVWQSEVLDDVHQHLYCPWTRHDPLRLAIASGHGIGKSAITGMLTTWALSCWRDPRIVITANSEGQLKTKTSPEVGQWVRSSIYADMFDIDTLSIKAKVSPDQHRCDFITNSENNPEAFAGLHAEGRLVMIIMDEASAIPDVIWETVEGALTDENTVLLWVALGNPTRNRGRFRECFRKNKKLWKTWQIDSRTVEGTSQQALQDIIDQHGEHSDTAKVRVKGQFPNASIDQFIPTSYVDNAWGRHLRDEQYDFAPTIIAVDPAWQGDDDLVIAKRQGLRFDILEVLEKNTNDQYIAAKIAHYEDLHKADAVFIDAGYGTGIYSAGQTMGRGWRLVWFGEKAEDPGYFNKRAEMWGQARAWLAAGGAIPKDQRLYDDLVQVETKPHQNGLVQLQPKSEMKKEGLPSPDRGDALALSFAYPVTRANLTVDEMRAHTKRGRDHVIMNEEYDPYGDD
jgi:hypothetical protein